MLPARDRIGVIEVRTIASICAGSLLALVAGCGSDEPSRPGATQPSDLPRSDVAMSADPASFTADVTNRWFPL